MRDYQKEFNEALKKMKKRMEEEKKINSENLVKVHKFTNTFFYEERPNIFNSLFDNIIIKMGTAGCYSPFIVLAGFSLEYSRFPQIEDFKFHFKKKLKKLINKEFANALSGTEYTISIDIEDYDGGFSCQFRIEVSLTIKL